MSSVVARNIHLPIVVIGRSIVCHVEWPFPIDDLLQSSSRFALHLGYQAVRHQNQGFVTASCAGRKDLSASSLVDEPTHQGKAVMTG